MYQLPAVKPEKGMPQRFMELYSRLSETWVGGALLKLYMAGTSAGVGFIFQAAQPDGAAHPWLPAIVSGALFVLMLAVNAVVKVYTVRVGYQSERDGRASSETELVINKLEAIAKEKDEFYARVLAAKEAEHARERAAYLSHYEARESILRDDRHRNGNRLGIAMLRLNDLMEAGRITPAEARIEFDKYEQKVQLSELPNLHNTQS